MKRSPASSDTPPVSTAQPAAPDEPTLAAADAPAETAGPLDGSPHGPERIGVRGWFITRSPFLVILAFGTYFAIASYELDLGTLEAPRSGLWPFIVSIVLIGCTLAGMLTCDPTEVEPFGRLVVRPLLGIAVLCLFVLLWDEVGLLLTGSLVLTFWFKVLARETWLMAVALAVGASVVAHVLFVVVLGARLPDDLIAQLWGG